MVLSGAINKEIVHWINRAGAADWGVYQAPGAFEGLGRVCSQFRGSHLIEGAGHWVQQEQSEAVADLLLAFLRALSPRRAGRGS